MKWILVFLAVCGEQASAARILALCAVASHSHSLWCYKYMDVLAERGHQITVLGVDEPKIKIANLTTFIAPGAYEFLKEMDLPLGYTKLSVLHPGFTVWNELSTKSIMHSKALKDLINRYKSTEKPFDLIIHDNGNADALLGLVPLFGNPPLLLATTFGSPQWMNFRAGNILNPAYVPNMIAGTDQFMTFYERCLNTLYYLYTEYVCLKIMEPYQDKIMREVLGSDLPHVSEIAKRANIVIVNHHFALNYPRPSLPGVIGISGLHISEPKPLPKDVKEFMDKAKDGVILVSFGSNVESTWFTNSDFEGEILKGLSLLPQKVLWKWDKTIPNLPPNVKISKWLPQSDMLVHPNMRLFVSHCGLLSVQETLYRKVPVLALPVFLDQNDNADALVRLNLTIKLNVYTLTAEELRDGIMEILSNPMYKRNIERLGGLMADTPLTPQQQAVYWTEYALRHDGAPHLHSTAADLPWHQLLLLDVLAAAFTSLAVTLWLIKLTLTTLFRTLFMRAKNKLD